MKLTEKKAEILLMIVISARATSFMFSKLCLVTMSPYSLIAIRFLTASALLLLLFHRKIIRDFSVRDALCGALFGFIFFWVLCCEHNGLKTISSAEASFLENMAIVIVPFLEGILHRRMPDRKVILRAFIAVAGVALLTVGSQGSSSPDSGAAAVFSGFLTPGVLLLLMAAALYAAAIITTKRLTVKGDTFVMGFFQVTSTGVCAAVTVLLSGNLTLPSSSQQCLMILALAVICTGFGFTLQPVAQKYVSSEKAGLFCALSPFVAGILSVVCLHEPLTPAGLAGEFLILSSLLIR